MSVTSLLTKSSTGTFAIKMAWKVLLLGLVFVAVATVLSPYLTTLNDALSDLLQSVAPPYITYFFPNNFAALLALAFTVKTMSTVTIVLTNYIRTKVRILAA